MTTPDWAAAWTDHATAFDRVRSVVMTVDEPRPAAWIADHAQVAPSTARDHLDRLGELGIVTEKSTESGARYGPDPAYVRFQEIRELTADYSPEELSGFVVELKTEIDTLRETHSVETVAELRAAAAKPGVSTETAQELRRAAADWDHYRYRLSLLEDAITRYDDYQSGTPATA